MDRKKPRVNYQFKISSKDVGTTNEEKFERRIDSYYTKFSLPSVWI